MHAGHNTLTNALGYWVSSSTELAARVSVFITASASLILLLLLIVLGYRLWVLRPPTPRIVGKGGAY